MKKRIVFCFQTYARSLPTCQNGTFYEKMKTYDVMLNYSVIKLKLKNQNDLKGEFQCVKISNHTVCGRPFKTDPLLYTGMRIEPYIFLPIRI